MLLASQQFEEVRLEYELYGCIVAASIAVYACHFCCGGGYLILHVTGYQLFVPPK